MDDEAVHLPPGLLAAPIVDATSVVPLLIMVARRERNHPAPASLIIPCYFFG